MNIFQHQVVKPDRARALVVVGNDDGMVAVSAVQTVNADIAQRISLPRQQADTGISSAAGEVVNVNIFYISNLLYLCDRFR